MKNPKKIKNQNVQTYPSWFKGLKYKNGGIVSNPYSNEKCILTEVELSIYELIKSSEFNQFILGYTDVKTSNNIIQGRQWFRENNIEVYWTLID
jgi:hypothetical protein